MLFNLDVFLVVINIAVLLLKDLCKFLCENIFRNLFLTLILCSFDQLLARGISPHDALVFDRLLLLFFVFHLVIIVLVKVDLLITDNEIARDVIADWFSRGNGPRFCLSFLLPKNKEFVLKLLIGQVTLKGNLLQPVLLLLVNHIEVTEGCLS